MDLLSNFIIPEKISEFTLKKYRLGSMSKYTYCKDDLFIMPKKFPINQINSDMIQDYLKKYTEYVLYDVMAPNDIIENKLKEKLFLNKKVEIFYEHQIGLLGYSTVQLIPIDSTHLTVSRNFEAYSIIDKNTNVIFYVIVSIFPARDIPFIIDYLNNLYENQKKYGIGVDFTTEEFSTKELNFSKKVHFVSLSADSYIEMIRNLLKNNGWKMILINEQAILEKQKEIEKSIDNIILCEGTDVKILSSLNIPNVVFSDEHNSYTIFQNVKTQKRKCLRDKDYLTIEEVDKLKKIFPNYYILNFYCIENYLYHPNNLKEYIGNDFKENDYIEFLIQEKNKSINDLQDKIKKARCSYSDLKENHINPTKEGELVIYKELVSDKFEDFYKHLDMKNINKSYLDKYNLNKNKLSSTMWFKKNILKILKLNNY
jgi:hypothetical protein